MPQDQRAADEGQANQGGAVPDATRQDGTPMPPTGTDITQAVTAHFAADLSAPRRFGADKFDVEARLIELGSTLAAARELFKALEHDFYRAAFGRYDE
ncbi:MAG TPA: hypothetical protein VN229_14095 [Terriglobales bacterium]|nr:hypothetical protein [Terriglobales bacterium]